MITADKIRERLIESGMGEASPEDIVNKINSVAYSQNEEELRNSEILDTDFRDFLGGESLQTPEFHFDLGAEETNLKDIELYSDNYNDTLDQMISMELENLRKENSIEDVDKIEFKNNPKLSKEIQDILNVNNREDKENLLLNIENIKKVVELDSFTIRENIKNNEKVQGNSSERIVCITDNDLKENGLYGFTKEIALKLMKLEKVIIDLNNIVLTKRQINLFSMCLNDYLDSYSIDNLLEFENVHDKNKTLKIDIKLNLISEETNVLDINNFNPNLVSTVNSLHKNVLEEDFKDEVYHKIDERNLESFNTAKDLEFNKRVTTSSLIGKKRVIKGFKKKEKKLSYPVDLIENLINEVIEKYKIDEKIFDFIDDFINLDMIQAGKNMAYKSFSKEDYIYSINTEILIHLEPFVEELLLESCLDHLHYLKFEIASLKKEFNHKIKLLPKSIVDWDSMSVIQNIVDLNEIDIIGKLPKEIRIVLKRCEDIEFKLMDLEHQYLMKEEILCNIFEYLPLNDFQEDFDKITLISYHYLCSYLEEKATIIWDKLSRKQVRGHRIKIEIFRYELVKIILTTPKLRRFLLVIKALINNWIKRFNKISDTEEYFEYAMINPSIIEEHILRYIALTVIKNKNPMKLRAVFSSYLHLIHRNLNNYFNIMKISNKFGHMKSNVDEENEQYFLQKRKKDFHVELIEELVKGFILRHPNLRNPNSFLLNSGVFNGLIEIDKFKIFTDKPKNILFGDWYMLSHVLKHSVLLQDYKFNQQFIPVTHQHLQTEIINLILNRNLFGLFRCFICKNDTTKRVLDIISKQLAVYINSKGYLDNNFKLCFKDNTEQLDKVSQIIESIKNYKEFRYE